MKRLASIAMGPRDDVTLWPVEGLRGLAAFMVMWWHLRHWVTDARGPDAFGYTGVDLFFVLSGFVFGLLLDFPLIIIKLAYGGYILGVIALIASLAMLMNKGTSKDAHS